jgi:hypothetical protein
MVDGILHFSEPFLKKGTVRSISAKAFPASEQLGLSITIPPSIQQDENIQVQKNLGRGGGDEVEISRKPTHHIRLTGFGWAAYRLRKPEIILRELRYTAVTDAEDL